MYIYQHSNWTSFTWDSEAIIPLLSLARYEQGKLLGRLSALGFSLSQESEVRALSAEVLASSAIEDVPLNAEKVSSSVARHLGAAELITEVDTREADGAVSILVDAVRLDGRPLDAERLFGWHAALFPTCYSGMRKIAVAQYRQTPINVVSGPIGHEYIHYTAPDPEDVPALMEEFIAWFNADTGEDLLIKAALAHLWFLTIHPFEDGNGRIARTLTERLLAESDGNSRRFYSMAHYILEHREDYYSLIEQTQKGTPQVTDWLAWFLRAFIETLQEAEAGLGDVLRRAAFWNSIEGGELNSRQRKMLKLLTEGFEGKLTVQKWSKVCKVSADTALRDINGLIAQKVLQKEPSGGRSTAYSLCGF